MATEPGQGQDEGWVAGQVGAIVMALAVAGSVAVLAQGGRSEPGGTAGSLTVSLPDRDQVSVEADVSGLERARQAGPAEDSPGEGASATGADLARPSGNSATPTGRPAKPPGHPASADHPAPADYPTPAVPDLPDGLVEAAGPYLMLSRPFGPDLENRASRYYPYGTTGRGEYLMHHGVDIGNPQGTPILAVADGTVVYAGTDLDTVWGPWPDFYGQLVILRHDIEAEDASVHTLYGHLSRTLVAAGDQVGVGEPVGEVGMTGVALGPHLHLEVRLAHEDYGATRNPELFLSPIEGTGVIVGRLRDADGIPAPGRTVSLFEAAGSQAGAWLLETTTYPTDDVNYSAGWNENFVFGDTRAGDYFVAAEIDGVHRIVPVSVASGAATIVTLMAPDAAPVRQFPAPARPRPARRPGQPRS